MIVNYVVLAIFALAVLLPVLWMLGAALSPKLNGEVVLTQPQWSNFRDAWVQADFSRHLLISMGLCAVVVAVTCVITPLAGYALAILKVPGASWLFPLFLAGIMIPLEGIVVPLYFDLRSYHLSGSLVGLAVAQIGLSVSFGVFWMRASFAALPRAIVESAAIDGAGVLATLRRVALPIVKPGMITMALLVFMWTWNDYFLAFVLINDPEQLPVTVALGSFSGRHTSETNLLSAAAVLVALPVVILYAFFQRQFISGVLSGALKG